MVHRRALIYTLQKGPRPPDLRPFAFHTIDIPGHTLHIRKLRTFRKLYNGPRHKTEKQRMDHFMKQTSCFAFVCLIEWSILIRKLKDSRKLYNDTQSTTQKQRMDHVMKRTSCFGFVCFIEWSILCFFVLLHKMIHPLLLRFAS